METKNANKRRSGIYESYDVSQNEKTSYHPFRTMDTSAPDNPYAAALDAGAYKNKRDAKKLYNSALEYEASLSQYERQLADQERLIREQRAYDSPAAQRQRMLEAGINPDLTAGSGAGSSSGSSGSVSAPAMTGTTLEDFTDPVQDFASVAGGVSSVIGSLSGVVDIARQVSTFSDALRLSSVAADSAEMEGLSKRIGTFGDIASMMTPKVDSSGSVQPFTSDEVTSFLQTNGLKDPDGSLASGVASYSGNPAMQKYYSDSILASRKAKADLVTQPFEALQTISDNLFKSSQFKSECERISSQFQYWYDSYLKTESNATLAAGNEAQKLMNDSLTGALDQQKITRDLEVWRMNLTELVKLGRSMQSRIDDLKKLPRTSSVTSAIIALESSYADIMAKGSDELSSIYELRRQFEHTYFDAQVYFNQVDPKDIPRFQPERKDRFMTFSEIVLSGGSASPDSVPIIDDLVQAILKFLFKKYSKGNK